jgi:hypothetical protein
MKAKVQQNAAHHNEVNFDYKKAQPNTILTSKSYQQANSKDLQYQHRHQKKSNNREHPESNEVHDKHHA